MTGHDQREADPIRCESEPIHIPGAIQPHGYLIAFREADTRVQHISANLPTLLDCKADAVLGQPLAKILNAQALSQVKQALRQPDFDEVNPLLLTVGGHEYEGLLHQHDGLIFLELERAQPTSPSDGVLNSRALRRLQKVRTLADLQQVVVEEVRALTGFDRVVVYRFDNEGDGQVVAEARDPEVDPYLELRFPASDIPAQARKLYEHNWIRLIPDARYEPVPLLPPFRSETGQPVDLSCAILRSVSPLHREYIGYQGLRASMSVSLMQGDSLWGLISCGHREPHYLPYRIRAACQAIGELTSLQINALQERDAQQQREAKQEYLSRLVKAMHSAENEALIGLMYKGDDLLALADASGAAILVDQRVLVVGDCPGDTEIRALAQWAESQLGESGIFHTRCLPNELADASTYAHLGSGLMAITLPKPVTNMVLWFRPELVKTLKWSGNPNKPLEADPETGQLRPHPRRSFAVWREQVRGRSKRWLPGDIYAVKDLRRSAIEIDLALQVAREREAVRARDEIVAVVSHDLRNPMTIVTMQAGLMQRMIVGDQRESSKRLLSAINIIQTVATRMNSMIGDLLDLSKIESGRFQISSQPHDASSLVHQAVQLLQSLAETKSIQLKVHVEDDVILNADAERLFQVLSNLISNGIKFTPAGGSIEISVTREGSHACFSIRDSGIGISDDELEHIFDRYWHVKAGNPTGTGLGLFISKGIVEAHGGRIWAVSDPGQGSTFHFTLPLAA
ncbi:GAF domain-containing protein [Pseudomonas sp. LTJR-52]|uniref:ATP-binding protein n=1 Tax=Pseudomonas sp. LTJR-52 TaxID=2479392 RepID=UPI000EFBD7F5|nr:ATP-binding protein [Pseudomonas sp. LTJR-52]AYN94609.1 GAF domain-containing protein [Pseudomonas sp. LTJR-52]